jgi:hypothetical protein
MKQFGILVLLVFGMTLSSCHKHDDIEVNIEVVSPADGQLVATPQTTQFTVVFTATGELHDIRIKVYPVNNPDDLIIDFDKHEHKKTFTFSEIRDLSGYPAGSSFNMDIEADKDEKGTEKEVRKISFRIP